MYKLFLIFFLTRNTVYGTGSIENSSIQIWPIRWRASPCKWRNV